MDRSYLFELAQDEVAATAWIALEAMAAVPSHADPLAGLPQGHVGTDSIDTSGNFVAGHARKLNSGPKPFLHQRVAMADSTCFDLDAHLTATGLGYGALDDFEISAWLADLHGFHWEAFFLWLAKSWGFSLCGRPAARVCDAKSYGSGKPTADATISGLIPNALSGDPRKRLFDPCQRGFFP
jgi:hypothetical protein